MLLATENKVAEDRTGPTSLGTALAKLNSINRQRGLVVVVGDFRGPRDWQSPLTHLGYRHQVLAIEVVDRRETEIPNVGHVVLMDPETGRQLRVDTSSGELRRQFAERAESERAEVSSAVAATGAHHLRLSTAGDWLRALADFLRARGGKW
jgi:uncharacterized protein (DUF58 family)